jgi:ribonucleoside-diphosphate reductase alpha chain
MTSNDDILIVKRSGDKEELDIAKIHKMVNFACEDISGVYVSQVEMNSGLQFFDGITSDQIQDILIKSAEDLISLRSPNYQFVAARLLLSTLVKQVFGKFEYPHLREMVQANIDTGVYDKEFFDKYTDEEIDKLNDFMNHQRDMEFTYAGLRQVVDKYLVQDRSTGQYYETPQYMYIMIAATLFADYPADVRLRYVKRYYDAISQFKINLPTPLLAGVRTPMRQFSSCVLVDSDDTLESIFATDMAIGRYTARRAGIGINSGRIRGIGNKIRGGEVEHTGVLPFLKKWASTTRCCTQNGVRGGNSTVNFPIWHQEIEDIIVLKNNKGTDDNRIRIMDYCIHFSKIFYERYLTNGDITLFSPNDVPDLYEAFYSNDREKFDELYIKYENSYKTKKKKIPAVELINNIVKEGFETGRIYILNADHVNTHGPFLDNVYMTNLCVEVTLPTTPLQHIDDPDGEIAICTLSAVNLGKIANKNELEDVCDLAVRALEELLDYQDYPVVAAEKARNRRSLGVGYIGVAHYLAKNKMKYHDPAAWQLMHDTTEAFQYFLLKSSNQIAKEKGPCKYFDKTKYSKGILPIDTYKQDVDTITNNTLHYDWEELRASIKEFGLRHSTLSSQMPAESSSVVCGETNGIEPPRGYLAVKKSKKGPLKQIVPGYPTLKNQYELLWDMKSNDGYVNIVAVMQKFFDQSISTNLSYNPENYEGNEVPLTVLVKDLLTCFKLGIKTRYYINTNDMTSSGTEDEHITDESQEDDHCEACVI